MKSLVLVNLLKNFFANYLKSFALYRIICYNTLACYGGIAQLARVLGSYPIGRRFESHCRYQLRLHGQAVKTSPFHGGNAGSIPAGVTMCGSLAQMGEHLPYKQRVTGSIPVAPTKQKRTQQCVFFVLLQSENLSGSWWRMPPRKRGRQRRLKRAFAQQSEQYAAVASERPTPIPLPPNKATQGDRLHHILCFYRF